MIMKSNWKMFPTGRWSTTIEANKGHIALHAWPSGSWAVTRGATVPNAGDPFMAGSREDGQPTGNDLEAAMVLAEKAARVIADAEHPNRQIFSDNETTQAISQPELFTNT